jgi:IS30 family transposase
VNPDLPTQQLSGVAGPAEQQARYFQLMKQGWNNNDACRAVGICRKTGTRWRLGRTETKNGHIHSYPALEPVYTTAISKRFLSEQERVRIADLHRVGKSMRSIAAELGRSASTISRELQRNVDSASGGYLPHTANRLAVSRRRRPRTTRIGADPELREFVDGRLGKRHSPEQISHELTVKFPDNPDRQLAVETLYQAIYQPGRNGLTSTAKVSLRSGRGRRRPLRYQRRRPGHLLPDVMIDARPAEANDRVQPGHLEGDLIIGRNGGTAIGTIVERTTRFLILVHLPRRRTATEMTQALVPALESLPLLLRRSLTWDQGKELAAHRHITATTGTPVFFCHAHSPWERGSNENMNGLLRQYFPKGTDLSVHSAERLAEVAAEINNRPRKTLGWQRPADLMSRLLQGPN